MIADVDAIEAALADAGWRAGAEALVAGWVAHQQPEVGWEETWAPDDRCRHVLERPGGERLVLEWVSGDTWELSIEWPEGWGREHVSMRWREDLEETAERIVRVEGPFGGPRYPEIPMGAIACGRGRRLAGDVELRFELLREDLAAFFFIARDGTLNNLWVVRINPDHLPAALDSLERTPRCAPCLWVQAAGKRRSWEFTAWRPLLARARIGAQELLLSCPDASTAVILAHTAGHLQSAVKLEMRALPDFDAGAWLAHATPWPTTRPDVGSAGSAGLPATPTVVQAGKGPRPPPAPASDDRQQATPPSPADAVEMGGLEVPEAVPEPAEHVGSAGSAGLPAAPTVVPADEGPPPPPAPASDDRRQAPPPSPADAVEMRGLEVPEPAPEPAEQPKPRFTLAPDASAEDIQRHFTEVETAIPPRLTGTATAVELWDAIRAAHKHRALPITGNWVDLVAELHHRGFLPHLPSDRASRAALLILAKLSPLVRRLHHRRWALGAGS